MCLLCGTALFAQGDFKLSEQMFSRINQNPSAVGNNPNLQIFTATRLQWASLGLDYSPTSALLNAHYYIDKINSGVGFSFIYDELGYSNQTINAKVCYAYNIDLAPNMLLSLGLSAGVINKRFDPNRHYWKDENDPNIPTEVTQSTAFDMDFGFEFSYKYVMAGFSMTHLPNIAKEVSTTTAPAHINAYVRGNVWLPKEFNLIPAMAYTSIGALNGFKSDVSEENIMDYSLTVMYKGKYWLGVGYRGGFAGSYSSNVASIMAGFEWHWLRLGYCCDVSVGKSYSLSTSTHEIMLSFNIPLKKGYVWP